MQAIGRLLRFFTEPKGETKESNQDEQIAVGLARNWNDLSSKGQTPATAKAARTFLRQIINSNKFSDDVILDFLNQVNIRPEGCFFFFKGKNTNLRDDLEKVRPKVAEIFFRPDVVKADEAKVAKEAPIIVVDSIRDTSDDSKGSIEFDNKPPEKDEGTIERSLLVPIYIKNMDQYPKTFQIKIFENDPNREGICCLRAEDYSGIEKIEEYFSMASKRKFSSSEGCFDVHDIYFQDLALRLLQGYSSLEITKLMQGVDTPTYKAIVMLIRAKNYAIAMRDDVDWVGKSVDTTQTEEKRAILEENKKSLILRDWAFKPTHEIDKTPGSKKTRFTIVELSTRDATIKLATTYPKEKICWVNFANAHKTGGGYQIAKSAQEEVTATAGDSIAVLGFVSEITEDGRTTYKQGFHIPAGGNYFHRTHFFTDDEPVECYTIVQPFADFRNRSYTEGGDFFSGKGRKVADIKDLGRYKARIMLDIRSVLRTAKAEKMDQLVVGASGCGAFKHVPELEHDAWEEVLMEPEFRGHFTQICFAILGEENLEAFTKGLKGLITHEFPALCDVGISPVLDGAIVENENLI